KRQYSPGSLAERSRTDRQRSQRRADLHMLWLKAFHIVFMVTWFAGLFYLPRLFVYHAQASDAPSLERFQVMERRLFVIMTIGAVLTAAFGVAMVMVAPYLLAGGWLHAKLTLVAVLIAYHLWCWRLIKQLGSGR